MTKKIYKIIGMHCASCAMLIEGELEDAGFRATCSFAKQTVEVEHQESISDEAVKKAIEQAGYHMSNMVYPHKT